MTILSVRAALWAKGPCRAVSAHCLPHSLPLASATSLWHLQCDLHSYLCFQPCSCALPRISLLVCSSPIQMQTPRISATLPVVKCCLPATLADQFVFSSLSFGRSVCFLLTIIWCLNTSACSMIWKSLNLCDRNCVPAHPVAHSLSLF